MKCTFRFQKDDNITNCNMHNGMMKTLADVVTFYNNGGGSDANKDKAMKPQILSIAGKSNSGKTTLLERLISELVVNQKGKPKKS